jgi:hypothetical protein
MSLAGAKESDPVGVEDWRVDIRPPWLLRLITDLDAPVGVLVKQRDVRP